MGTMTALLDSSRSALANMQAALDMTAENIANKDVSGYARRTAIFSSRDSVTITGAQQGLGADVTIAAQRDRVLEQRVQQSTQASSSADARLTALQQMESIFNLTSDGGSDASGISASMNALFNAFSSLQADPSGSATRQAVLSAAQQFAATLQTSSAQLQGQQTEMDSQVASSAKNVNSLLAQIADVNGQIASTAETSDAGTLEDQRQGLLNALSQLMNFQQVNTDGNGISLATSDGAPLVTGSTAHTLVATQVDGRTHLVTDTGSDITSTIRGGSLGGLLQVRDSDIPAVQQSLDTLAYSVANAVNAANASGLTPGGVAGAAIFSVPPTSAGAAASISVALTNISGIAAALVGEGPTGNGNAAVLAGLSSSANVDGTSPSDFFGSLLSAIGATVSSATSTQALADGVLTQATSQRDALSGVSLDEEAANLTQYQRSYEAAAKVFTIVDELMASAINLGITTTVT